MKFKVASGSLVIVALLVFGGALGADKYISSKVASRVQEKLPRASDVHVSIPISNVASDITSSSIKSARVKIGHYMISGNSLTPSLSIIAKGITKSQPTIIDDLSVVATIPLATIENLSGFGKAQIVGDALRVTSGLPGGGQAILLPKFSNNQFYFQLISVSAWGKQVPAALLPASIQADLKARSLRNLSFPKGLNETSISLSTKGLSIHLRGTKFPLDNLF